MRAAFPDLHYDIEDLVAEGDTVVARWRMTGTHEGDLAGPTMSVPPSGKRITLWGMSLCRIEGGMVAENWERFDMTEFLGQLGVIRSPGQSEEGSPTYSPECVEGAFSEVRLEKIVRLGDTPGCLSGHHTCVSSRGTCHPTKRSADA